MHDMPTIEGGDAHYVSTNLAEVGSEKLRAASSGNAAGQNAAGNTSAQSGNSGKSDDNNNDDNQEGGDK